MNDDDDDDDDKEVKVIHIVWVLDDIDSTT